jgi:hypothetical protein
VRLCQPVPSCASLCQTPSPPTPCSAPLAFGSAYFDLFRTPSPPEGVEKVVPIRCSPVWLGRARSGLLTPAYAYLRGPPPEGAEKVVPTRCSPYGLVAPGWGGFALLRLTSGHPHPGDPVFIHFIRPGTVSIRRRHGRCEGWPRPAVPVARTPGSSPVTYHWSRFFEVFVLY